MSNSIYNQLAKSQPMNPMQALNQLKQNPSAFLKQAGFSVPDGINNPQQIIQHLMQSGQINQTRPVQAQQMARGIRR